MTATAQALPDVDRAEEFNLARRSDHDGAWRVLDAIRRRAGDAEEQFTLILPPDLLPGRLRAFAG